MVMLFAFAIMMIFHVSMFGYTYVNYKNGIALQADFAVDNLKTIDVSTSKVNIIIQYDTSSGSPLGSINVIADLQGIMKDDVKEISYVATPVVDDDGVLKIETKEPTGWYFKNNSKMIIELPNNKSIDNIIVNTGAKSISIGEDTDLEVKNLEITASKKFLNSSIEIGDRLTVKENLTLKTNYGRIVVNSKIDGNVNVDSLAGSILINKNIAGDLNVTGVNPTVEVGLLPGDWRNKTSFTEAELNSVKKVDVLGHVTLHNITDGGNIKVSGTIHKSAFVSAPYVQFWANNILEGINCDSGSNNIKVFGAVGIDGTDKNCNLDVGDGGLFINKAYTTLNKISANKGDVYIANAYNDVIIESNNSDVFVNFAEDVTGKSISVVNENRNIKVTNISGLADLYAKRGSVEATFLSLADGENKVEAARNLSVEVKDGFEFKLITKAKAGSVDVEMLPLVYKNWDGHELVDGWKIREDIVNNDSTPITKTLLLKMNGSDKLSATFF